MAGYAGKYNLLPAYDQLVAAIRRVDNDTLLFYEPVTYGAYLPSTGFPGTGFDRVPGGEAQRAKSVLSYHYYCFFLSSYDASKDYPDSLRELCDKVLGSTVSVAVIILSGFIFVTFTLDKKYAKNV